MDFKHVYLFVVLSGTFSGKFIPNINNEHAQDYSCPGVTFAFCSYGEKLPWQGGLPGVVQRVTPPLIVAPGQLKTHVNSYRRQTMHRGKVDPGVNELPRGNELSRDHVNRPLENTRVWSVHIYCRVTYDAIRIFKLCLEERGEAEFLCAVWER